MSATDAAGERPDVISLSNEEAVKEVVWKSVLGLWDRITDLTRLPPTRRERYRVSILGSARVETGTFGYEETKRVAAALAEMGEWARASMLASDPPLAGAQDLAIPQCVPTGNEAIALIRGH